MTTPVDIDLNLDPSGYISGLRNAADTTSGFAGTLRTTSAALTPLQRTMNAVTPSRAMLAGQGLFIAQAAKTQRELSGVQATAAVTGVNVHKLTGSMRELAREMPIGNQAARMVVQDITRMGVAADGSEVRVGKLAESFVRLHGSTGEDVSALTQGMVQLSRTMDTGTSPERIEGMADSLVEVTKATGTSAVGVLGFSKAIAPLADAAGIGQTAVMGISASFSKMGEDGFAGAMAVNKMLTDLNSSVREGSPQMAVYAQMVGKTTSEFQALFESNPAEALTQITEAIAAAGPRAPVLLEQLGLEGVRSARAITGAVASGDIRGSIATAVSGYGSGANERASEAAFGGLTDSLARLRASTEQVADALGGPFLGAVTGATNVIGAGASVAARVGNTELVQTVLKGIAYVLGPVLLAAKLSVPALKALGFVQAATSGPVRGLAAGIGSALPDNRQGQPNVFARYGRVIEERYQAGEPLGRGPFNAITTQARAIGVGVGNAVNGNIPRGTGIPGGLVSVGRGVPVASAFALANTYFSAMANSARNARLPADQRDPTVRASGRVWNRYFAATDRADELRRTGRIDDAGYRSAVQAANTVLRRDLSGFSGALRQAGSAAGSFGTMLRQSVGSPAALAGRAAMGVARLPGMMLSGGGMMAMMAAAGVYTARRAARESAEQAQLDNPGIGDEYNAALGRATESTATFAGRMDAAATSVAASATTMADALQINLADVRAEGQLDRDRETNFSGSTEATTALLLAQQRTGGLDAQQLSRISLDLIGQYGRTSAQEILNGLDNSNGLDVGGGRTALQSAVSGLAEAPTRTGFVAGVQNLLNPSQLARNLGLGDEGSMRISMLTEGATQNVRDVATTVTERYQATSDRYGPEYAEQERRKDMDALVDEAYRVYQETGEGFDVFQGLVKNFQTELGIDNPRGMNVEEINEHGSFTRALAARDDATAQRFGISRTVATQSSVGMVDPATGTPTTVTREGEVTLGRTPRDIRPELQDSYYMEMLAEEARSTGQMTEQGANRTGNLLQPFFSRLGPQAETEVGQNFQRLLTDKAGDPGFQVATVAQVVESVRAAGGTMGELAISAQRTVNAIANLGDAGNLAAQAIGTIAMAQMGREALYIGEPASVAAAGDLAVAQASQTPTNAAGFDAQQTAVGNAQQAEAATIGNVQQILLRYQEMQVGRTRMTEDYHTQLEWAEADHLRQLDYMRADYERSVTRAEDANQRQRARSYRDFATQMRRIGEDLGKALYEPYQRIQVEPLWDGWNLLGNLQEQVAAARVQLENLARLREMGVSDETIRLLGLNESKHAQQAQQLVDDVGADRSLVGGLNQSARDRTALGGQFRDDPSNTDVSRLGEDFAKSMADAAEDFSIAMTQMETDQATALDRAAVAYTTATDRMLAQHTLALDRAGQDWTRAAAVLTADIGELTEAFNQAMTGQFVDYQKITSNGLDGWYANLQKIAGAWKSTLEGTNATMKFTIDAQGITTGAPDASGYTDRNADARQTSGTGEYSKRPGRFATGAVFVKGGAPRTWGEESDEVLLPLDNRGAGFLASVMQRLTSRDALAGLQTAGTGTTITYVTQSHVIDQSTRFEGAVTVQASDPDEMAAKLAARSRRAALTAPPQRR